MRFLALILLALPVMAQPVITSISVEPAADNRNRIELLVSSVEPGSNYTTEITGDLSQGFLPYVPFTATGTTHALVFQTTNTIPVRFYRVRVL